jgi:hypothetical protein
MVSSSANGSRKCAPDDRLRRMIQYAAAYVINREFPEYWIPLEPVIGLAEGETPWRA